LYRTFLIASDTPAFQLDPEMGRNNTIRGDLPRSGCRGGKAFEWDQVKDDKQRVCYLGNSIAAPIGKWQRGRDVMWYTKNVDLPIKSSSPSNDNKKSSSVNELDSLREKERKLMSRVLNHGFGSQTDETIEKNVSQIRDKNQQFRIGKNSNYQRRHQSNTRNDKQ
jgi:hypothetical protein